MGNVVALQGWIMLAVVFVTMTIKIFAFVSALTFSGEAYRAADKLSKPAWLIILGLAMVVQFLLLGDPLSILNIAFLIAALVYLADVRPALSGLRRR